MIKHMEIIFKTWIRKHVEGTQEYKDHVYIRNAIRLQRDEFTSCGFSLYQFFFHRNRYCGSSFTELKHLHANCQQYKEHKVNKSFLSILSTFYRNQRRTYSNFKFVKWFHLCVVLIRKQICCCCSITKLCLTLGNPWTAARQSLLSSTISWSLLKFISTELVMLSKYLILCHPFLHLPLIFPNMRVFSWKDLFLKANSGMLIIANSSNSIYIISLTKLWPLFYKKLRT